MMKFCGYCGKQLDDNASFCFACGKEVVPDPVDWDTAMRAEEEACLDELCRFFKYERLAWKIGGIVMLILSIFFMLFGVLFLVLAPAVDFSMTEEFVEMGVTYIVEAILVNLPIAIVNLSMIKRAEYYMNARNTDAAGLAKRAGAAGMIVLGVMFNTVAMIFIIINFTRAKSKKEVLDRIVARQESFCHGGI